MLPYRLLRELSGYNPIYEIEIATFSVISENSSKFATLFWMFNAARKTCNGITTFCLVLI